MPQNPRIRLLPDGPYIEIDGGSLYLGRDCILAVRVPELLNRLVSNRHLRIWLDGARWMLEDLGSTNGTWLRGARIAGPVALRPGDVVALGKNGPQFAWEAPTVPLPAEAAATLGDRASPMAATLLDDTDGSAEHPFRVGRTPAVVLRHRGTGKDLGAKGYTVVIGRDPSAAQIVIRSDEERHISGRHAELQFRSDGSVVLRDLGSRNGTWVNDKRVKGDAPLRVGDRIVLGSDVTTLLVRALEC